MAFQIGERYLPGHRFTAQWLRSYGITAGSILTVESLVNGNNRVCTFTREDGTGVAGTWSDDEGWFTLIQDEPQPADRYALVWVRRDGRITISGGPFDSPEIAFERTLGAAYRNLTWPIHGEYVAVHAVPLRAVATLTVNGLQHHGGAADGNAA